MMPSFVFSRYFILLSGHRKVSCHNSYGAGGHCEAPGGWFLRFTK